MKLENSVNKKNQKNRALALKIQRDVKASFRKFDKINKKFTQNQKEIQLINIKNNRE